MNEASGETPAASACAVRTLVCMVADVYRPLGSLGIQVLCRRRGCGHPHPDRDEGTCAVSVVFVRHPQPSRGTYRSAPLTRTILADPRTLLLQVNNPPADPELTARYPHRYWSISDKKTYGELKPVSARRRHMSFLGAAFAEHLLCSTPRRRRDTVSAPTHRRRRRSRSRSRSGHGDSVQGRAPIRRLRAARPRGRGGQGPDRHARVRELLRGRDVRRQRRHGPQGAPRRFRASCPPRPRLHSPHPRRPSAPAPAPLRAGPPASPEKACSARSLAPRSVSRAVQAHPTRAPCLSAAAPPKHPVLGRAVSRAHARATVPPARSHTIHIHSSRSACAC